MKKKTLIGILVAVPLLVLGYVGLTGPMPHPEAWSRVEVGMTRAAANKILDRGGMTATTNEYMLYRRVGLRLWWLNVSFQSDRVSRVRITAEDPHDTLIQEINYLRAYLPRAIR